MVHLMRRVDSLEKTDAGRDWGQEEKGTTEDEMAGQHQWLDGRESQWTPGVGDGQGGLECCDSWGRKELDMTERLNWNEFKTRSLHYFSEVPGDQGQLPHCLVFKLVPSWCSDHHQEAGDSENQGVPIARAAPAGLDSQVLLAVPS